MWYCSSESGDGLCSGRSSEKPTVRAFSWRRSVTESSQDRHLSGREGLGSRIGQRKELGRENLPENLADSTGPLKLAVPVLQTRKVFLRDLGAIPLKHVATAAKSLQSCLTLRPHRRQPIRLPRPWDSPGKNTGVGCHFLLQYMKVKSDSEVTQSCLTLSDPMDCSLPGSFVHGIF